MSQETELYHIINEPGQEPRRVLATQAELDERAALAVETANLEQQINQRQATRKARLDEMANFDYAGTIQALDGVNIPEGARTVLKRLLRYVNYLESIARND